MSGHGYWQFIFKSMRRRAFRNFATVLTFAVVIGSIMIATFLTGGASNSARAGMERLGADLLVVPEEFELDADAIIITGKPSTFFVNGSAMDGIRLVEGVEQAAPQTFIATLSASCCALPTQLIAFNSTLDFTVRPWLDDELGRPLERDEIILGNQISGEIGESLVFFGHPFYVAGILEPTGTGVDQSIFVQDTDALVMAKESFELSWEPILIKPGEISAILVKLSPGADADEVSARIEETVPGVSVISSNNLAKKIDAQLTSTVSSLYLMAGAVTIVSIPLIATVSSLVANERRREIGLLRMMGAKKSFVFQAILMEALLLALIGAIIGTVGSSLFIVIFKDLITTNLGIPFLWPGLDTLLLQVWLVMLAAISLGALSALYPAIVASRADPYDAIRSGRK